MKIRKKRSPIWAMKEEDFINIVGSCKTIGEILSKFELRNHGGNPRTLRARIKFLELNTSHLIRGKRYYSKKNDINFFLVENCTSSRSHIKKRLIQEGFLQEKCCECGIGPFYNNKSLSLQLDHINGINNDNRLENLRLLCPNCHSQTDNFAGKRKLNKIKTKCIKNVIESRIRNRKVLRPSLEVLEKEIKDFGYVGVAKRYNVSDTAIKKWVINYKKNGY